MQIDNSLYNAQYGNHVSSKFGYPHFRNKLRITRFIPFIDPQPNQKILEIGCNDGMFLCEVAKKASSVIGIDVNKAVIEKQHDPRLRVMSGTRLEFPDLSFDTVYSFEVIEHIPEIRLYFSEVNRVLRPKGKLVISFPFELFRGMTAIGDAIHSYGNPLLCRQLHVNKLSPKAISSMLHDTQLQIVSHQLLLAPFPTYLMVMEKSN